MMDRYDEYDEYEETAPSSDDLGQLGQALNETSSIADAAARIKEMAEQKAAEARARMDEGWEPAPRRNHQSEQAVLDWERTCPELYRNLTWENIADNATQEFLVAREKVDRWLDRPEGNLIISGPVGTGKTTLALAACRELARRKAWHPRFVTTSQFFDDCRPGGPGVEEHAKRRALLLDDVGAGRNEMTEFEVDRLTRLIDERHLNNRITIVTTNSTPRMFKEQLGERLYDRLLHGSLAVVITGPSQRTDRWADR